MPAQPFESEYRRALFIRMGMVVATFMIGTSGLILTGRPDDVANPEIPTDTRYLLYVFYGVCALMSIASIALRRSIYHPPAPQGVSPQRLLTGETICGALAEGIAVFGFAVTVLWQTLQPLYIMVGWSLILQVITFPRRATWQRCLADDPYDSGVPKIG